jgi:hypothetical protein
MTNDAPRPGPVRLGDLIAAGKLLWVYCCDCGRERDVDPASLNLDRDRPVPGLGRAYMKCSACGSRNIDTRPELYPGGIEVYRASWRQPDRR